MARHDPTRRRVRASSARMIPGPPRSPIFGGSTAAPRRRRASPPCSPPPPALPRRRAQRRRRAPRRPALRRGALVVQPARRPAPRRGRVPVRRPRGRRRRRARASASACASRRRRPRHNQAPLGDMEDLLLVNVSRLQDVHVDPGARSVRVGAGVKWDRVAPRLSAHGLAGLHGSSPDVGIAGYSLGGGMGWLARKHGLQTNAVTALELVTADGELHPRRRRARARAVLGAARRRRQLRHRDRDRVRRRRGRGALRGRVLLRVRARGRGAAHLERHPRHSFPDELMSWASLLHFPPIPDVPAFARGRSYAVVMAAFLGSAAEGAALLAPLRRARPRARHVRQRAAGRARRPRHGPARPGALPEHLGAARRAAA